MSPATAAAARRSRWVGNPPRSPHETRVSAPGEQAEAGQPRTHTQTHSKTHTLTLSHPGARALVFTLAHAHPAQHEEGGKKEGTGPSHDRFRCPPDHRQQREWSGIAR